MLLLKNNKLVQTNLREDPVLVRAMKSKADLNSDFAVKNEIRELVMHQKGASIGKYNFVVVQSSYSDDSSLGSYYSVFDSKGDAISKLLSDGYSITINGEKMTREDLRTKSEAKPNEITQDCVTGLNVGSFNYYEGFAEARIRNLKQSKDIKSGNFMVCCGEVMFVVKPEEYPEIKRRIF
jgi:hypothetical protein